MIHKVPQAILIALTKILILLALTKILILLAPTKILIPSEIKRILSSR